ncbi:ABC transporter permease [Rhodovulum adriaticum]|uniref:Putative ABC transport system permease protein n=1 Tax=Rhodovulum adriaticum TaxID=35804 RepID=A0A4R2NKA3_RHOAD|nr:ABC transporter permease [Rhodovulum adriaticum]MBK1635554.1 ABC transporter permease [Rhodovulum adriaticum]TCP21812.1 putative ABC transport system permease protein [Rhodovulum adriaticum]
MWRVALSALLSHWRRHPLQLATLLLGLALATALWSGVQAINAEARASYARAAQVLDQDRLDSLVPARGLTHIGQDVFVTLRRAGWQVTPVLEGQWSRAGNSVLVYGLDPFTAPAGSLPDAMQGEGRIADFIAPPGLAYAAPQTVEALQGVAGLPPLVATRGMAPGMLFTDIGIAQTLLRAEGRISRLLILPDQPLTRPALTDIAPALERRAPLQQADTAQLTGSFHLNLTAFGFLSFAVGLFIVHSAIGLAFEQRRAMFRTLRALGVPLRVLVGLLAAEVMLLALAAGLVGVALGYAIAAALLPDVAATLRGLYGASVSGSLALRPAWWLGGLAMALAGAGVAGGQSLWRLWSLPLLAPAQPTAWARASARALRWQGAAAGALAVIAVLAGVYGSGIVGGFLLLGALLISAALALPGLLALMLGGAARLARGPLAQWFWADTRQQLPGLSLALMALLLALSANIGVGTMVSSFRLTFTAWLDQRLPSELYVTARDMAEAQRLHAWLEPRSDALLPIWKVEGTVLGGPAEVYGVADHRTYPDNWPLIVGRDDVWQTLARGQGAIVNEQLWRRAGLSLGDAIPLPGGAARPLVGVYADYGNPKGQVIIGVDDLTGLYPDVDRRRYAIRTDPAQVPGLKTALVDEFGLPADNMIDQGRVKEISLMVFERTFLVTGALNVLTMGVAGFAMFTSLLTLSTMRLPQLAPVWALGLTRARLARLELGRALLLAALTMIVAVPVGLLLAWVLLAVVNVAAFGWKLPMHVFPTDWLWLGVLALAAAGLAAAWPAWRLARLSPTALLKVFADER